ncbi:guanine nucleotide binding protein, alpha subunit [Suillus bovinus]|uniref:guanine nucleotide binding protein, alpha subunit n=1 Tax=Suillus bovinus TaxID=48563 RepID=UPI001B86F3FD|nr:guanine nucleotide binding protein, alpha subunit [Suillus bovinus]KAG2139175.1 guanine nucleotide binding protein, alpha subunit [Suillus bovinus]
MIRTSSIRSQDDPLSLAIRPPPEESDSDRHIRLQNEAEARRISEQIDEELRFERERLKKSKSDVKLLLLGQAESGKSTLQKQFQLMYSPASLESERMSWRTVVYFNVVRSIKKILTTLEAWDDIDDGSDSQSTLERQELGDYLPTRASSSATPSIHSSQIGVALSPPSPTSPTSPTASSPLRGSTAISDLRRRLLPLTNTEPQLADGLSGGVSVSGSGKGEVYVRSGWQARTIQKGQKLLRRQPKPSSSEDELTIERPGTALSVIDADPLVDDVARMLEQSREDIRTLWENQVVRALMTSRKLKLDEWSEFFLNDISRISARNYVPSTDDILHARIQTMGVAEHIFDVDIHGKTVTWHLFDVGGARGQRHSWVPYFDDANAIIFVSPISAFDQVRASAPAVRGIFTYLNAPSQYLEEDPRTNRIDDSLQLFTQICSNQLLKKVHLVLFLNKTDILRKKLERGLSVSKYILSYGDRPNEYESVVQYFRAHFLQVHRRNNENRRVLYTHLTNVVDTKATQSIIGNVRDSIFRGYLQSAALV